MLPPVDQRNKLLAIQERISDRDSVAHSEHIKLQSGTELLKKELLPIDLKVSGSNNFLTIEGVEFDAGMTPLRISGQTAYPYVVFINCSFSHLIIQNTKLDHIIFINSTIHGDIRLENTKLQTLKFKNFYFSSLLVSYKSSIEYLQLYKEGDIGGGIYCNDCEIKKLLYQGTSHKPLLSINETKIHRLDICGLLQYLSIKDSTIEDVDLYQGTKDKYLHSHHTAISNSTVKELRISNFNQGHFFIQNHCQIGKMEINHSIIGDLYMQDSSISQTILASTKCGLTLEDITASSFNAENATFTKINLKGTVQGKYFIDQCHIGRLIFLKSVIPKDGIFSVASTNINSITFEQLLASGQLQLKEIKEEKEDSVIKIGNHEFSAPEQEDFSYAMRLQWDFENYDVNSLTNGGALGMELCKTALKPQIKIFRSSMGKAELIGCDLSAFNIHYCNSKLLEMFFAGTTLPLSDKDIHATINKEHPHPLQASHQQKANLYSQLKKIFDSQGNIIEGSLYHSRAMHYQQKLLSYEIKAREKRKSTLMELWFENLAFHLNRISNNHGESWWRAFWFIFFSTLITFIAAVLNMKYQFSFASIFKREGWFFLTDYQLIADNFKNLPGFFLPTHKLEYLSEGTSFSPEFGHFAWDVTSRILIGYGIYQFISAFRRHSRKGS